MSEIVPMPGCTVILFVFLNEIHVTLFLCSDIRVNYFGKPPEKRTLILIFTQSCSFLPTPYYLRLFNKLLKVSEKRKFLLLQR